MNTIIAGGGVVGFSLAEHLLKDDHQLVLVEKDEHLCQSITDKLDIQVLCGSGSSPELLKEAGVDGAHMVLAVTPDDEVNLVVCALAKQYNVGRRIARLRREEFTREGSAVDLGNIGVTSVIHPEKVLADQIFQYIETPHAVESANFEDGNVLLRAYRIRDNMEMCGKTLQEIRRGIAPAMVLIAAIVRKGSGMIPMGNTQIEAGDIVYALFPRDSIDAFLGLVGIERKKHRKIIITGDSYATFAMVRVLERTDHKVTLVDPDKEHAGRVAEKFGKLEVIHGDCTESDLLRELNIDKASFFIALSDGTDYNMLSTLVAKVEGAREVVATATDARHDKLFRSIGIDHIINPRLTAARAILDIISRGHIGAAVPFSGIDIEAVKYTVEPESEIVGLRVKRVAKKIKRGTIIGTIVRDNQMILPDGETTVEAGDHVIAITHHKNIAALSKLFRPRGFLDRG
jgi:trk system potassium uptake protein TrkA